jgi:hypothetical protein
MGESVLQRMTDQVAVTDRKQMLCRRIEKSDARLIV